jgi:hypothetical protein
MTINLQIKGGAIRAYPQEGDDSWGVAATNWASDVTTALNQTVLLNEILSVDAIIGSALQVANGEATHISISAALADVSTGLIYVLPGTYTVDATEVIDQPVSIIGSGEGSVFTTSAAHATGPVISITVDGVSLKNIKIAHGAGTPTYALSVANKVRIEASVKVSGTYSTDVLQNLSSIPSVALSDLIQVGALITDHVNLASKGTNTHAQIDTFISNAGSTYAPIAKGVTNGDTHDHNGGDGAQIDHVNLANKGTTTHADIDTHIGKTSEAHGIAGSFVGTTDTQDISGKSIVTDLIFKNQAAAKFAEQSGNGTNFIALSAPDAVTADCTFKLPDGDGTTGQLLKTDGSKNLSWVTGATTDLNEYHVNIGNSSNSQQPVNTNLLGDAKASYSAQTVTFDQTGDADGDYVVKLTAQPFSLGDRVYFTNSGGALPTGLSVSTTYYVTDPKTNTFKLSDSRTGSVKTFTGDGSGTSTVVYGGLVHKNKQFPPQMSNEDATQLGYKVYLADKSGGANDIAYNGGNKATISTSTGSMSQVYLAYLIPYQVQDKSWRLKFNVTVELSSASRDYGRVSIAGVSYVSANIQAISVWCDPGICAGYSGLSTTLMLTCGHATATTTRYMFTGDIAIDGKPNWAY